MFLNLIVNALDAVKDDGAVTVTAAPDRRGVRVDVKDTGCGMTDEERQHAFDLFYTTKGPDAGTGLGLSIVHNIVTGHGGSVEIESRPGEGTRVCV